MSLEFGLEEEVFIVERNKPALDSLYPLYSLVKNNPNFYYLHTAVNLARGKDILDFFVASVEISTGIARTPEAAIEQLRLIRKEFVKECPQKVACLGMLPNYTEHTSLVSGFHVHISGDFDFKKARIALAHYLPALLLITANSPSLGNDYFSNRILQNPFSKAIVVDSYARFQDIIISRRLNTLEIRIFDPCVDLDRYLILLELIEKIILSNENVEFDFRNYAELRKESAMRGISSKKVEAIVDEICSKYDVDKYIFTYPPAIHTKKIFLDLGEEQAYAKLDALYRQGIEYQGSRLPKTLRALLGFFGYYIPKIPFSTYKFLKEHGYI
ncbi:MAG: hypothetical protein N2440_01310 [Actinobacteria bacterium]|nr:hypothetical protein [Actinomycetota bacterium]